MSQKEKLIQRYLTQPSDFTYEELKKFLEIFNYIENESGKTSGSAVFFINKTTQKVIRMHKPHPENIVKKYVLKNIKTHLEKSS